MRLLFSAVLILASCVLISRGPEALAAGVDYAEDVKPILMDRCASCHGALKQEGGLRLDAATLIQRGGDSGAVLQLDDPAASELYRRVAGTADGDRMPPEGKPLDEKQLATILKWLTAGAPLPVDEPVPATPDEHWAFQRPVAAQPPHETAPWIRNDIDRFLARSQREAGLVAAALAPREKLLRRVYLDLIGVPPTAEQLSAFVADESPDAYEKVVDQLLESPLYGQRWARHWMDIWRYSDPSGYGKEIRDGREHIWRWRDWIVQSLDEDVGYDEMIIAMLAADEAYPGDLQQARATGFLARNWYKFNRNVWLDNIVEHSSKAFLGLTTNCARCHDHKYDPVSQEDYFALRAIFETHDVRDTPLGSAGEVVVRAYDVELDRPTYLFTQGDERKPDKSRLIPARLPDIFGQELPSEKLQLPVQAFYPALRPEIVASELEELRQAIPAAGAQVEKLREQLQELQRKQQMETAVAAADQDSKKASAKASPSKENEPPGKVLLHDEFQSLDDQVWIIEAGEWEANGVLRQTNGATQQFRLLTQRGHPRNFVARTKMKIAGGEMWRSVGIGFDIHGQQMTALYLSAFGPGTKVQVSTQNDQGTWSYPPAGAKSFPVELNRAYDVEIRVRDQLFNLLVDGKLILAYALPQRPQPGQLALWTFSATAEFQQITLSEMSNSVALVSRAEGEPAKALSTDDQVAITTHRLKVAQFREVEARRQLASYETRLVAERAKYGLDADGDWNSLAEAARLAEQAAQLANHDTRISELRLKIETAKRKGEAADAKAAEQLKKLSEQRDALTQSAEQGATAYSPLGALYPQHSSGRRLAYASWIVAAENPLASRVAVNHIWRHHFGRPLVERVDDFGLRSPAPRHQELLDWLAVRFVEGGWKMKSLHRLMVTSGAYQLDTEPRAAAPHARDPDNHYLSRWSERRMDAEVVRDSMLAIGGLLDVSTGGKPLPHSEGQTTRRRSLYYQHDKERQMTFLNLFDGANVNECYARRPTVSPQQALAMYNSRIADDVSAAVAKLPALNGPRQDAEATVTIYFAHILNRRPSSRELAECRTFLESFDDVTAGREQLALVLLNHNDFVMIR